MQNPQAAPGHPVLKLPDDVQKWLTILFILVSLGMSAYLYDHGKRLRSPEACLGIVSFELPVTKEKADAILDSWERKDVAELARRDIRIDFLFLLLYPLALFIYLATAAKRQRGRWRRVYVAASWASLPMMPLDAVENLLMLQMLDHGPTGLLAAATTTAAAIKFLIFFPALYLAFRAMLYSLVRRD
jgi:hypothetical protein